MVSESMGFMGRVNQVGQPRRFIVVETEQTFEALRQVGRATGAMVKLEP